MNVGVPLTDSSGAADMFLSIKGEKHGKIEGEAQDAGKHKNEIEVVGWSWGMKGKSSLSGGGSTGRATVRELQITKKVDRASPALMGALRFNENIKEAVLTVRKFGKTPLEYLKITIEDGRVTSLDLEIDPGSQRPEAYERVSFSFNKLTVVYTPQAPDGSAGAAIVFEDQWQAGG